MATKYDVAEIPLHSDSNMVLSEAHDVLQRVVASVMPGCTFVLINEAAKVVWIRDYGTPESGGAM